MSALMTRESAYQQGCVDGAMRVMDTVIEDLKNQDKGKVRSKFKSAVERVLFVKNNLDMEASLNGYCSLKKQNRGYIRGAIHGASIVLVTVLITAYFLAAFNAWGWMQ